MKLMQLFLSLSLVSAAKFSPGFPDTQCMCSSASFPTLNWKFAGRMRSLLEFDESEASN